MTYLVWRRPRWNSRGESRPLTNVKVMVISTLIESMLVLVGTFSLTNDERKV